MDEQNLLSRLRHGDEQALAAAITQYSAYVVTVIPQPRASLAGG